MAMIDGSESASEAVSKPKPMHALNVLVSEYDYQRAKEAAVIDGPAGVSGVVRAALHSYLDGHPAVDHINEVANEAIEFKLRQEAKREAARIAIKSDSS